MINSPEIKIMDFLAIDRFTGGGKEGAKFDALVLWQPSFKVRIFIENPKEWQIGWIMLVLKDLKDGFVSCGYGRNKWFDKITTEDEEIKVGAISQEFIPCGLKISNSYGGIFNTQILKFKELVDNMGKTIELWIDKFHEKLLNFNREDREYKFIPISDTYFKDGIVNLYPKEISYDRN